MEEARVGQALPFSNGAQTTFVIYLIESPLTFSINIINLVERYLNVYFPVTSLSLSRRYQRRYHHNLSCCHVTINTGSPLQDRYF